MRVLMSLRNDEKACRIVLQLLENVLILQTHFQLNDDGVKEPNQYPHSLF